MPDFQARAGRDALCRETGRDWLLGCSRIAGLGGVDGSAGDSYAALAGGSALARSVPAGLFGIAKPNRSDRMRPAEP
jgi:hypothetical protein